LPEVRLARLFGRRCATELFHFIQPAIFAYHAWPLNKLRKKYALSSLGNLLDVYTHADYTLYPDLQTLFPTAKLPVHHHYIGPIQWSPDVGLPHWWEALDAKKPIVYVNLGSSGPAELLPTIIETLGKLPLTIVLATAGRWQAKSELENLRASEYLPGDKVADRAALVICNGGSPSVYQALAKGVPVIGIASNLDQFLCMSAIETAQAGLLLRAGQVSAHSLQKAVQTILREERFRAEAQTIAGELAQVDAVSTFRGFLKEIL
jgi:UDP:flavonoid glycosyltransferase YjiC (YdhE family)